MVELSPHEFEAHVEKWLRRSGLDLEEFSVTRLEHVPGHGGEYEMDVVARFTVFGGAQIVVLVECKHHKNPIKRDALMVLESKLRDTKAHKGMLVSTSSFQSGALHFARIHGIATVDITDLRTVYSTSMPSIDDYGGMGGTPVGRFLEMRESVACYTSYIFADSDSTHEGLRSWLGG